MRYCKKCGVLYSGLLEQCPKCNTLLAGHEDPPAPQAPKGVRARHWAGICLGVPALILFLYVFIGWMTSLSLP